MDGGYTTPLAAAAFASRLCLRGKKALLPQRILSVLAPSRSLRSPALISLSLGRWRRQPRRWCSTLSPHPPHARRQHGAARAAGRAAARSRASDRRHRTASRGRGWRASGRCRCPNDRGATRLRCAASVGSGHHPHQLIGLRLALAACVGARVEPLRRDGGGAEHSAPPDLAAGPGGGRLAEGQGGAPALAGSAARRCAALPPPGLSGS